MTPTLRAAVVLPLLLAGCRKATEAPDAGTLAPTVTEFPVPTARSTLSLFEPAGTNCEWRQLDPIAGTKVVLASFPGTCVGAKVSFSPDASKAIVWFDPGLVQSAGYSSTLSSKPGYPDETRDEKATTRAFVVSTRKQKVDPLPLPAVNGQTLQNLGIDSSGAVVALLEEAVPENAKGEITSGTEKFDLSTITEGLPVLVHAYRREGTEWKKFETKLSTTGWDYGLGVKELEASRKMGPSTEDMLSAHLQGDSAEGDIVPELMKLAPKGAKEDDGNWIFFGAGGARLYVWEIQGEFVYTTGLIAAGSPPAVLPKLGFTDGDLVAIRTSGPFVLISDSSSGTHPRIYEMPAAKLVFSSDTARAATFWPTTAKAESHEAK
jgi:hypothetical protein